MPNNCCAHVHFPQYNCVGEREKKKKEKKRKKERKRENSAGSIGKSAVY